MSSVNIHDKFQVGRFYGFTAPQLMMTSRATLSRLLKLVENTTSVDALNELKTEVIALELILTENKEVGSPFKYNETSQTDDYLKQLKSLAPYIYKAWGEPQDFKQLQRKRVSTLTSLDKAISANEIGEDFTQFVKTLGLTTIEEVIQWKDALIRVSESSTSISNKVEINLHNYNDTIILSPLATKLLNEVYKGMMHTINGKTKAKWFIERIDNALLTKVSQSTKYFGENLGTLNYAKTPLQFNRINMGYRDEVNNTSNVQSAIITLEKYIKQCQSILNINEYQDSDSAQTYELPDIKDFKEYLTEQKSKVFEGQLQVALGSVEDSTFIIELAKRIGLKKSWYNSDVISTILNFKSTHQVLLESEIAPHLTEVTDMEEMQDVFDELTYAGVMGLTVFGLEIMIEEIERQSLARKESLKNNTEPSDELAINSAIMMSDAQSKLARLDLNKEREQYYVHESLSNIRL